MTSEQAIRALGTDYPLAHRILLVLAHMDMEFPVTNGELWQILNEIPDEVTRVMSRMQEMGWLSMRAPS